MSFFSLISGSSVADPRKRRCYVYENIGGGYHLLLVDDDGGLILAEQVSDFEIAVWLARLVNEELAKWGALL
jgi:hypothetical protein